MQTETLAREILSRAFDLIERGVKERPADFHTPVLVTTGADNFPEARTVVLRKFERATRDLLCHVDLRSPKVPEIQNNPNTAWLFYHQPEKLQLRIRATTTVHTDDELANQQWRASQLFSRRCYCGDAPGTLKDAPSSGLPAFLEDRQPTAEETETLGRKNFAVLQSKINKIEVYELNVKGHRRSLFIFDENGNLETRWLTP